MLLVKSPRPSHRTVNNQKCIHAGRRVCSSQKLNEHYFKRSPEISIRRVNVLPIYIYLMVTWRLILEPQQQQIKRSILALIIKSISLALKQNFGKISFRHFYALTAYCAFGTSFPAHGSSSSNRTAFFDRRRSGRQPAHRSLKWPRSQIAMSTAIDR